MAASHSVLVKALSNFQCSTMVRKCAKLNAPSAPVKACWATKANGYRKSAAVNTVAGAIKA